MQVVAEDLSHGYGNATPLLTVGDRLRHCDLFAVAFGDDLLLPGTCAHHELASMHRLAARGADAVIAAARIEHHQVSSYGIIDADPADPTRVVRIRQRPDAATVTEPLAVVSRLVLWPSILLLVPTERARGEVDLGIAVGGSPVPASCGCTASPVSGSPSATQPATTRLCAPTGPCTPRTFRDADRHLRRPLPVHRRARQDHRAPRGAVAPHFLLSSDQPNPPHRPAPEEKSRSV